MELWFSEKHTDGAKFSVKVDKQLYSAQSNFQRIDVFASPDFGRLLVIDGYIMLTEKDEFIYHEMITHAPMAVHPHARDVLVIGGGDGGVVRELARYDTVERIDLVEIDEMVVKVCRELLPVTACKLNDPRLRIFYEDGAAYVRRFQDEYDLIIVDSTDPVGPGEGLFGKDFYGDCFRALRDDGILVNQHESPFYDADALAMQLAHRRLAEAFAICRVYQAFIPTYPSGHWLFGFASKKYHPTRDLDAAGWKGRGIKTGYYNTDLHRGAFALPNYVLELLKNAGGE